MPQIAVFMGTRPEAIKMAPVIKALERDDTLEPLVVSTGQHREMLQQVVDVFELPVDVDLNVMRPNQTLAGLTARLMTAVDGLLDERQPDFALVQGDTTTVFIAALACFYRRIGVGHVEAGLRTGNMRSPFPEEANRRLAAPLMDLHFPPTDFGRQNLLREGVDDTCITVTGNTVIDALQIEAAKQEEADVRASINTELTREIGADWRDVPYVLITGHRRENFGGGFENICDALADLAARYPSYRFIYPVHLNPNVKGPVHERLGAIENILLIPPKDYRLFVALMKHCYLVLTDSGGVQEEAPGLGKPVLVMRDTTERPEGVEAGTVKLVGAEREAIVDSVSRLLDDATEYQRMSEANNPYGDGRAAERIADALRRYLG